MKRLLIILMIFVVAGGAFSCKSFLEEDSPIKQPLENYFQNEEEAVLFLYGGYALVKSTVFGTEFISVTDLLTDDMDFNNTDVARKGLSFLSYNPTNKMIKSIWGKFYSVIEQVNILIDNIENNPNLTKHVNLQMAAEARFIRAWAYFNLVQIWGEVPLVTVPVYSIKTDYIFPSKSSREQIYSQIVADLTWACGQLGDTPVTVESNVGISYPLTIKLATAKLLLGKTYILMEQWQDALEELTYFGIPGDMHEDFGLVEPYEAIFNTTMKNLAGREMEVLWEIEAQASDGLNNTLHRDMAPKELRGSWGEAIDGLTSGYQNYLPTYDLISSFDTDDKRYRQSYQFVASAPSSKPHILKGYDVNALDQNTAGPNVVLLRTADAYLSIAEAYNELGVPEVAKPFVDMIRERAGLAPLPTGLSQSQMREAIMLERRHEFAHEGAYRLFDLRRTGTYGSVMLAYNQRQNELVAADDKIKFVDFRSGNLTNDITIPFITNGKPWQEKHALHPIPADELVTNRNIKQNTGW